jgi:hypothetical protein
MGVQEEGCMGGQMILATGEVNEMAIPGHILPHRNEQEKVTTPF